MRRLSFALLFSTWISFGVSTVTVPNDTTSGEYGSSLILRCNVTGNDTFAGWKTPAGNIANNTSVFKYEKNGIDLKILKLVSNISGTWTCLSKGGNGDTVTVTLLVKPTTNSITPTPTKVAATSDNTTLSSVNATTSASDNTTLSTIKETMSTSGNITLPTTIVPSTSGNITSPTANIPSTSGNITSPTTKVTRESSTNMSITIQDGHTLVSWKPSKEGKAFYFIRYRRVGGDWMNTSILTQNKHEFSNLDPEKKYEFQVFIVLTKNPRPYTKIQSSVMAYEESDGTKKAVIAAVVISLVLLALIVLDICCCFCNKCGFFYSCMQVCNKGKGKYKAKDGSPQEGMNLNELNENQEDPGWV